MAQDGEEGIYPNTTLFDHAVSIPLLSQIPHSI